MKTAHERLLSTEDASIDVFFVSEIGKNIGCVAWTGLHSLVYWKFSFGDDHFSAKPFLPEI